MNNPQVIVELIVAFAVFGGVLAVWTVGLLLWAMRRNKRRSQIERRLGLTEGAGTHAEQLNLWKDGERHTTTINRVDANRSLVQRLDLRARRAGWSFGAIGLILLNALAVGVAGVSFFVLTRNIALAAGAAIAAFFIVRIYIEMRIARREATFERQLVEALKLSSRSLRAGHPLMGAFQLVAEEMPAPVSELFYEVCQQHEMGANIQEVLRDAADRSTSPDMRLFAASVAIQIKSGGNLADLMQRLANVIRDRIRLTRRMRILTAQTQMSKRVLIVLPFVLFLVLSAVNPDYMMPLYQTTPGRLMLTASIILLACGAWVMNRMADLKY